MTTLDLARDTVVITNVYPVKPGKKSGYIKDADGRLFGVWPNQMAQFQPGRAYEIEYTEKDSNGTTYRDVKAAKPAAKQPEPEPKPSGQPTPQSNGNSNGYYRPTAPRDAERMFVTKVLGDFIGTGRLDLSEDMLIPAVNILRSTWQNTFGKDEG